MSDDKEIKVHGTITIIVGDKDIELTIEQAKSLTQKLKALFNDYVYTTYPNTITYPAIDGTSKPKVTEVKIT